MNNSFQNILFLLLLIILQFSIILTSKIEIPFPIYQSQTIYSNVTIGTPIKRFPSQKFSIELIQAHIIYGLESILMIFITEITIQALFPIFHPHL